MAIQQIDPALIYKQLEHLEREIRVIKRELAQVAPIAETAEPEVNATWEALQEAMGLRERE